MPNALIDSIGVLAVVAMLSLAGCGRSEPEPSGNVRIAAAASVQFALDAVIEEFRKAHPTIEVAVTYGASGNFLAQLRQRAPFDLFLSADTGYPQDLIESGDADAATFLVYARGRLAIWGRADWLREQRMALDELGLAALVDPRVERIAVANSQHAPYGEAAMAAIRHAGILDQVRPKLVHGENIAQAAHFVQSGAAELGVIALSLAMAPAMAQTGQFWPVPSDHHDPLEQGAVILRRAADRDAAEAFLRFVQEPATRAIMERYGFVVPESAP